ncbi:DNA-binding CsgD family transcriptional regulator [Oxalobacteraceae bacterium GrIS 1.11]
MTEHELTILTGLFYDGVLAPQGWRPALEGLAAATASQAASLVLAQRKDGKAMVSDRYGLPHARQHEHLPRFYTLDCGIEIVGRLGLDAWHPDTPVALRRGASAMDATARHGRGLVRLLPHIRRAATLRVKFMDLSQQLALSTHILDRCQFPLLVMSAARDIVQANRLGEQWLAQAGQPFGIGAAQAGELAAILADACGASAPAKASSLALKKADGSVVYLTAVPLPEQAASAWHGARRLALLWINDTGRDKAPAAALLRQVFHLTPAEIRLVRVLLDGAVLQEAARQLDISVDTGRSQLKSVFAKLNIRKQTELHRLLGHFDIFT